MFTEMVVVGEKTGKIEGALREISQFYQKEIERSVQNLISLIEPAMIVILGIGIGIVAVSVIMPLYKMISAF
jgi:type IV pilus assembly protein PilC